MLIVGQLVMGQLIVSGHSPGLIKAHQHSGYLTVVVTLAYIGFSMAALASRPNREEK